jgi:glutaredoxin
MKSLLLLFGLLLVGGAQADELYRSVDTSGKVHYGDKPLPEAQDVEELKLGHQPPPDQSLPYETQVAKQNFPVTLYVVPDCPACQQARELLDKRGIPFKEISLVKQNEVDAFRKASGDSQVPTLLVGKTWLKGFLAETWQKELNFAGYPKTAPYRPRPVIPPAKPAETPPQPEQ